MPKKSQGKCVVFDVGKTFAKVSVVDDEGFVWAERRRTVPHLDTPLYRAFDVETLYRWLIATLRELGQNFAIDRIMPVTHGATCAFLDAEHRLVQPIQDYESAVPEAYVTAYGRVRPGFDETQSPRLPHGLNLGCQIYWHARRAPSQFRRVRHILNYPQYWAWRLTGALCNEVTSMGCHTDLWCPVRNDFSSLAKSQGWSDLFPAMQPAWEPAGTLRRDVAEAANLPPSVRVCVGLHDSNAALASVIVNPVKTPPALLSTGTWYIAMAPGTLSNTLPAQRDCLANVDIYGRPVACARFMGGRIYEMFTGGMSTHGETAVDESSLRVVMRQGALALPSFIDAGGPFPGLRGGILGRGVETTRGRATLGLLYVALMASTCLDLVKASEQLLIEGPAAGNPLLCGLIAALRPGEVVVNDRCNAVTLGAAALAFHDRPAAPARAQRVIAPVLGDDMRRYRDLWRGRVEAELVA